VLEECYLNLMKILFHNSFLLVAPPSGFKA